MLGVLRVSQSRCLRCSQTSRFGSFHPRGDISLCHRVRDRPTPGAPSPPSVLERLGSERALGVAIRKGQDAGEIRSQGTNVKIHAPGIRGSVSRTSNPDILDDRISAATFFSSGSDRADTYAVSDEQFEEAIADAKFVENMSRANVVRHVKQIKECDERTASRL